MLKNKEKTIAHILRMECGPGHEDDGAYHNDPKDAGGETKYGISKRAFPKLDISKLPRADAEEIYDKVYWRAIRADALVSGVDLFACDFAVNAGTPTVNRILNEGEWSVQSLYDRRRIYYHSLAERFPEKFAWALEGWLKRCDQTLVVALELERAEADEYVRKLRS